MINVESFRRNEKMNIFMTFIFLIISIFIMICSNVKRKETRVKYMWNIIIRRQIKGEWI